MLGASDAFYISLGLAYDAFNKDEETLTDDEKLQINNAIRPQANEFFRAVAAVELLVNPEVAAAADKLRDESKTPTSRHMTRYKNLIRLAKEEFKSSESDQVP